MGTKWEVGNNGVVNFKQSGTSNLVLENNTSLPGSGVEGQLFWKSDTDVLYVHDGTNFLAINGASAGGWTDTGVVVKLTTNTDQIQVGVGSVGTPALAFEGDINTGLFSVGPDVLGIAVGGQKVVSITDIWPGEVKFGLSTEVPLRLVRTSGNTATSVQIRNEENVTRTAVECSLNLINRSTTVLGGLLFQKNALSRTGNFSSGLAVSNSGVISTSGDSMARFVIDLSNFTEGAYFAGTSGNNLRINNTANILAKDGAANLPVYSFSNDPNTGIFRKGDDNIGFSAAGSEIGDWSSTTLTLVGDLVVGGNITVKDTTNQLVLGVTNTITITAPAPSASRILTIPDPGANASFVMTASNQTIGGVKNFTASETDFTGGHIEVGSGGVAGFVHVFPSTASKGVIHYAADNHTNDVTLRITNQPHTGNLTYKFPNAGVNADFVLTKGTQVLDAIRSNTGQSAFSVNISTPTANVTGDGTQHNVEFDTEIFDQNNDFNTGTFTFTAPVAGIYQFSCSVRLQGFTVSHTFADITLVTSNRNYRFSIPLNSITGTVSLPIPVLADMDASDTAFLRVSVGNATKVIEVTTAVDTSWFSGHLIS